MTSVMHNGKQKFLRIQSSVIEIMYKICYCLNYRRIPIQANSAQEKNPFADGKIYHSETIRYALHVVVRILLPPVIRTHPYAMSPTHTTVVACSMVCGVCLPLCVRSSDWHHHHVQQVKNITKVQSK